MKYRKFRIAWSVVWGVLAVLLVCLWVRSYWYADALGFYSAKNSRILEALSRAGAISLESFDTSHGGDAMILAAGGKLEEGFSLRSSRTVASLPPWQFRSITTPVRATQVIFPHWLPVLFSAAFAIAPFIRQLRYRYSLRTLLIATTLAAIVLGLIVAVV